MKKELGHTQPPSKPDTYNIVIGLLSRRDPPAGDGLVRLAVSRGRVLDHPL